MKIEFSEHALNQLKLRSIVAKAMVVETLQISDETIQSYRDRKLYRKAYDEKGQVVGVEVLTASKNAILPLASKSSLPVEFSPAV